MEFQEDFGDDDFNALDEEEVFPSYIEYQMLTLGRNGKILMTSLLLRKKLIRGSNQLFLKRKTLNPNRVRNCWPRRAISNSYDILTDVEPDLLTLLYQEEEDARYARYYICRHFLAPFHNIFSSILSIHDPRELNGVRPHKYRMS